MSTLAQNIQISVTVNGREHQVEVPADLLLVDFLRDTLELTGAKSACDTGHCGACVVMVDGVSVKSCAILAAQTDGSSITTVEGVAQPDGTLSPLQASFQEKHALQCGYCTPGMVISLTDLLARNSDPSETEIREWMDGNLCRCGAYQNIVSAVRTLAEQANVSRSG